MNDKKIISRRSNYDLKDKPNPRKTSSKKILKINDYFDDPIYIYKRL